MKPCISLALAMAALLAVPCFAGSYSAAVSNAPFQDITSTGTKILTGTDDATVSANIGFSFEGLGSAVWISSNGLLGFGAANNSPANTDFDSSSVGSVIAPLWSDWQFFVPGTGGVYYETLGQPGNEEFVVEWSKAGDQNFITRGLATFEAVLQEGTGMIQFSYGDVNTRDANANGASATVGLSDIDGSSLLYSFDAATIESSTSLTMQASSAPLQLFQGDPMPSGLIENVTLQGGLQPTPEPSSLMLFASGIVCGCLRVVRQRRKIIS
jgi:hypothetical protein